MAFDSQVSTPSHAFFVAVIGPNSTDFLDCVHVPERVLHPSFPVNVPSDFRVRAAWAGFLATHVPTYADVPLEDEQPAMPARSSAATAIAGMRLMPRSYDSVRAGAMQLGATADEALGVRTLTTARAQFRRIRRIGAETPSGPDEPRRVGQNLRSYARL